MKNEIDKLQWAKMFIDYLANGVDPTDNMDIDEETLHNEQIIDCFMYISDVLARNIYHAESDIKHRNIDFFITEEQCAELRVYSYSCKVSEIANEINRVTSGNGTKKLSAAVINDWLEKEGFLRKSDLKSRIPTEKGEQLGISFEYRIKDNKDDYYINYYSKQAQEFVFQHIGEIIAYKNADTLSDKEKIQCIDYPDNLSIGDFIRQQQDKCFIMSVGSCDSVSEVGSYIAVLFYKGKSKVLKKSNIPANSANKCILTGILDAASAIKSPTEVAVLSSTPLGFNTPKSKNYHICRDIIQMLVEKECKIYFSVCQGKGYELNSFIKSFG